MISRDSYSNGPLGQRFQKCGASKWLSEEELCLYEKLFSMKHGETFLKPLAWLR
jgi:hypothetical protein